MQTSLFKTITLFSLVLLMTLFTAACSSQKVSDYKDNSPKLVVSEFFNGKLKAHGVVKNRSGEVIRHFSADIDASWQDGIGTLDEDFVFNDGEEQKRIWTLTPNKSGEYIATANDVVGKHKMQVAGNALFMDYILTIAYKGSDMNISVDDKMFLVTPQRIINESVFYKFGFKVGSVQLVIEKI
jgi:hypothetical protein